MMAKMEAARVEQSAGHRSGVNDGVCWCFSEVRVHITELSACQVGERWNCFWHPERTCHPRGPVLAMKQLNMLSPAAKNGFFLQMRPFPIGYTLPHGTEQISNAAGPHSVFPLINMFLPKPSH